VVGPHFVADPGNGPGQRLLVAGHPQILDLVVWVALARRSSTGDLSTGLDARRQIASTATVTCGSPPAVNVSPRFQGASPTGWMRPWARIGVFS